MTQKLSVDAVYVLSVRTFKERIAHVEKELARHEISLEFIFEHDAVNIDPTLLSRHFDSSSDMRLAEQSLVLKHIEAWRRCVDRGHQRVLVLEDDVVLHPSFVEKLNLALTAMTHIEPAYLLFLGGADTRVPAGFFLEDGPIFKNPIATTDGYVTDSLACIRRLKWLSTRQIALPSDHLLKAMDPQCEVTQYWTTTPLVEQGSVFGLFSSTLDLQRESHSRTYNLWRYRWKIFQRRTLPRWAIRTLRQLRIL